MKQFSERLAYAMDIKKMTQAELSRRSGINKGSISNYLSGRWSPKGENMYKLATVLDVDPLWLDGKSENMNSHYINEKYEYEETFMKLYKAFSNSDDRTREIILQILNVQKED